MRVKRLIFDMDGTLADTAQASVPACREAARRLGLPEPTPEAVRAAIGIANPEFYDHLFPGCDRKTVRECGRCAEALEAELTPKIKDILFPGVGEMLKELETLGYVLYIASTGDPGHVYGVLTCGGIIGRFREICCGEPEKVRMVSEIIGDSDPSEWAMIGDHEKDLRAARENGIYALAAGFGYCDPMDFPRFDAALLSTHELIRWLERH